MIDTIFKRDKSLQLFNINKINSSIIKCFQATSTPDFGLVETISGSVLENLTGTPTVEDVQNEIEKALLQYNLIDEARHYISYRSLKENRRLETTVTTDFVDTVLDAEKYFKNDVSQFCFWNKYSRFIDSLGRRETWTEAVDRVVSYYKKRTNEILDPSDYDLIRKYILEMKAMPSMRVLSMAGEALDWSDIGSFNCFSGDTTFVTSIGIKTLKESVGLDIEVLTNEGFKKAHVLSFGKQQLNKVVLKQYNKGKAGNYCHEVYVTNNHRWILQDNIETTSLKVGDKLVSPDLSIVSSNLNAIRHGFIFGDGTLHKPKDKNRSNSVSLRLCGKKNELLEELFSNFKYSSPPSFKGDHNIYLGVNYCHWKELPTSYDKDYVAGFIQGLLLSDGSKTSSGNIRISSQDSSLIAWLENNCALAGYKVLSKQSYSNDTNYGPRSNPLQEILIGTGNAAILRVESIEVSTFEEVYCVVEPTTHTFTLGNGQLTGNCCFVSVEDIKSFSEIMYVLMAGTGVGFSVENSELLPEVSLPSLEIDSEGNTFNKIHTIVIEDTSEGWAYAFDQALQDWFDGIIVHFDYSQLRPAGARLKKKGGFSAGPKPLRDLFKFCEKIIKNRQGQKLRPIDVHDIVCKIGDIVISGGVRRSALLSLSNLNDLEMRTAKSGNFYETNPQRALSNNSAAYNKKPGAVEFLKEWTELAASGSGERGIFNREAVLSCMPERRKVKGKTFYGTNPCSEIQLLSHSFCNLTECPLRFDDTTETILEKIRVATIMGTIQSTFTNFKYIRDEFRKNAEEERLLGVSLTGQMDCPIFYKSVFSGDYKMLNSFLNKARDYAIEVNKKYAAKLGINPSLAITTGKPSGTLSLLVNSSAGCHPRHSKFYKRNVQLSVMDPMAKMFEEEGHELYTPSYNSSQRIMTFYVKAPEGAITRRDITALQQLEYWLNLRRNWAEHSISCSISVSDNEWVEVGAWVYKHFDEITGLSFFPRDDNVYDHAPFEEITEAEYLEGAANFNKIKYYKLPRYEKYNQTGLVKELACVAGNCEI